MTLYAITIFLHIVGALGLFSALGLEWVGLIYLRHARTVEPVREWFNNFGWLSRMGPISMGIILLSGFYMMHTTWGGVAWIIIAIVAMVLMVVVGLVLTVPRMKAIGQAAATENGAISPAFQQRLHDPLLRASLQVRLAIGLGIVFLMTVKPDADLSLLTMGIALGLGLVSVWPGWGYRRTQYREYKNEI